MRTASLAIVIAAGLLAAPSPASARLGPPGICNPMQCGAALHGIDTACQGFTVERLATAMPDALDLFPTDTIARMEVIRRAVMTDPEKAEAGRIIGALALRALEAAGQPAEAGALFDVGYTIYLFRTMGHSSLDGRGAQDGIAGYAFVARAIALKADAGMHVGAAYMTLPAMQPRDEARVARARVLFKKHVESATRASTAGGVVDENLAFVLNFEQETPASLRSRVGKAN